MWASAATMAQLPDIDLPSLPQTEVDSNYLKVEDTNWSLRVVSTFKLQGVLLSNKQAGTRLIYAPITLYSVGLGITYKYLTVDFGFNPVSTSDVENSRFVLGASVALPRSIIDFSLNEFRGYNLRNHTIKDKKRADIQNMVVSLDYMHLFNLTRVNIVKILQGGSEVRKGATSWGVGGFATYHRLKADSSLVPPRFENDFNAYGHILRTEFYEIGVLGGITRVVRMPANFFLLLSATPGFGLNLGEVQTEDLSYRAKPWVGKLLLKGGLGYSGVKHYYLLSLTVNGNYVNIGHNNSYGFSSGQLKLVMGFRIKKRIKPLDQFLGG